ncbi:MAG: alpha/beta hydrolase [Azospirillaceae bacterium]
MADTESLTGRPAPLEKRTIAAGAGPITCHAVGEGPAVILLASVGRGAGDLFALATALSTLGLRAVLPEPRGVNGSTPTPAQTLHDFADDVAAVARTEGGRVIVAGHAYGASVARAFAQRYPDSVRGVALLAIGAPGYPKRLGALIDGLASAAGSEESRRAALLEAFFVSQDRIAPWLVGWHPALIAMQRRAIARLPGREWTGTGNAPVLDLMGAADPFRPEESRDAIAAELGARVTCHLMRDVRHALPDEKPGETAGILARWARSLEA